MHRLRMAESDDLRELLSALRRLAAPLARRGAILFMQVDDANAPTYLDVRLDGFNHEEEANAYMCRLIVRFVRGKWRFRYMRRAIWENHPYLTDDEADFLAASAYGRCVRRETARHISSKEAIGMESLLNDLMNQSRDIHLDGVLRFRFGQWLAQLRETTNERVDEYLASREYDEFIGVLQYFLDTTPVRAETLHVVCNGEEVLGLDDQGRPIDLRTVRTIAQDTDDDDLHPQDILMSALITRSPQNLIVHTETRDEQFVNTLERVFRSRVHFCDVDPDCRFYAAVLDNTVGHFYTTF
ncbi:MAG: sporulation protein YtxC [Firmicutes bacterium]|nr:sporulation protein YtxC [Bacillota bacterium]